MERRGFARNRSLQLLALLGLTMGAAWLASVLADTGHLLPLAAAGPPEHASPLAERLRGLSFETGRVVVSSGRDAPVVSPDAVPALLAAAEVSLHEGRTWDALASAGLAVRTLPDRPLGFHLLGLALQRRSRFDLAEAAFRTALDRDPTRSDSRYELGLALQARGRLHEAQGEWQLLIERDPRHGPAHARLAALAYRLGDEAALDEHRAAARALGADLASVLETEGEPSASVAPRGAPQLPVALAPRRVDVGAGDAHSAETIVVAGSGQDLVASWTDLRTGGNGGPWKIGAAVSLDGGSTWADRVLAGPLSSAMDNEGDPFAALDRRTGNQWVGGILFGYVTEVPSRLWIARRQAGQTTFSPPVLVNTDTFLDKALLAAGPRPNLPNTTRLYLTYDKGIQRSDDLGASWSTVQSLGAGIGFLPRIGPNGVLYIAYWDFNFGVRLLKSTDGGLTFAPPIEVAARLDLWGFGDPSQIPGTFRVAQLNYLAVDRQSGAIYVVYPDTSASNGTEHDADLYFTRSLDGGATWSTPTILNGDSTPARDQFHPWLEVDDTGRLHLIFLDTRSTAQLDTDANAMIDVWYATSDDGGSTWAEMRITPQPFESRFATFAAFQPGEQFVGDYIGLTTVGDEVHLFYPSTAGGHTHVYAQALDYRGIFADGFETGDTTAWSDVVP